MKRICKKNTIKQSIGSMRWHQALKRLYFIRDEKDLQEKYHQAVNWFHEMASSIDQRGIEELIKLP
jgi:hypothetical protein